MFRVASWVGSFLAVATVVGVPQLWAQQSGGLPGITIDSLTLLSARVDELDQQVRILSRIRELASDSAAAAAKDKQSATANGKDGFSLKSADGKYTLRLRGYVQSDGRFFVNNEGVP